MEGMILTHRTFLRISSLALFQWHLPEPAGWSRYTSTCTSFRRTRREPERGREREGGREGRREGGREEGRREGGREGRREGGREGRREGGRGGRREGGKGEGGWWEVEIR